jgi:hypothetical protein
LDQARKELARDNAIEKTASEVESTLPTVSGSSAGNGVTRLHLPSGSKYRPPQQFSLDDME